MRAHRQLILMGCFTLKDAQTVKKKLEKARTLIAMCKEKGFVINIKRDLFVSVYPKTKKPIPNPYFIATKSAQGAYISHHTAFEFHGLAKKSKTEICITAPGRCKLFVFDGLTYKYVTPRCEVGIETKPDGTKVTDLERTVLDTINDFVKIGGLEKLLRCLNKVRILDHDKLIEYLKVYNKEFLYHKVGYFLEFFQKKLNLPDSFYRACQKKAPKNRRYLYEGVQQEPHIPHTLWNLYTPLNLMTIIGKKNYLIKRIIRPPIESESELEDEIFFDNEG